MIPSESAPEDDRTLTDLVQSSADRDQTRSDRDQTDSDRDQGAADLDQMAADTDQAGSDRALASGIDGEAYVSSREARDRTTQARRNSSSERQDTASSRDATAHERDLSALRRDQAARARDLHDEARDREDDVRDAEIASLTAFLGTHPATNDEQIVLRAGHHRQQAASHRAQSAAHRADARRDRDQAANDRRLAAEDRAPASQDRIQAAAEREQHEVDMLTGARRRGAGLTDMQRAIRRANQGTGRLIVAYLKVPGLKATNDSNPRHAQDAILRHIVDVLQSRLGSYQSIIRLGDDELVCAIPNTTIENERHRFDEIVAQLSLTPDDASISFGLAELMPGDSPMDLIDRADRRLTASRNTQVRNRHTAT